MVRKKLFYDGESRSRTVDILNYGRRRNVLHQRTGRQLTFGHQQLRLRQPGPVFRSSPGSGSWSAVPSGKKRGRDWSVENPGASEDHDVECNCSQDEFAALAPVGSRSFPCASWPQSGRRRSCFGAGKSLSVATVKIAAGADSD